MKIIGSIEHPTLKITVFQYGNRISLKFENERYEQTYKLGEDERWTNVSNLRKLVDSGLGEAVVRLFQEMHRARLQAEKHLSADIPDEFEEII